MTEQDTINGADLAAITGLTDRRHRQLAKDGYFPPPKDGKYLTLPALRGLFVHFRKVAASRLSEMHKQRERKVTLEADILTMEKQERSGELVSASIVLPIFQGMAVNIRQIVKRSSLSEQEKHDILREMQSMDIDKLIADAIKSQEAELPPAA